MNNKVKRKWIEGLKTYKQGKSKLKTNDSFCCLGVLCDIHAKETGQLWEDDRYLGYSEILPYEVKEWAGLDSEDGKHDCIKLLPEYKDKPHLAPSLMALNDNDVSFERIAEIIEELF